jgi:predicted PurR-regulated permease PerM
MLLRLILLLFYGLSQKKLYNPFLVQGKIMNTAWSKPTKYIVGVSLALLGIFVLYLSRPVIPLLIVAALIAVVVRPAILGLHQRVRLPLGLAVAVVYLILLILAPLLILLAIPTIVDAVNYVLTLDYQSIFQGITEWLKSWLASIQAARLPIAPLDTWVDQTLEGLLTQLQQVTPAAAPQLPSLDAILGSLGSVVTATFGVAAGLVGAVVSQVALVLFMFLASIYISLGAHTYRDTLLGVVPAAYQPEMAILLARIERLWNAFFRGQLTLMLLIGVISWLGLTALGVPGALYLGITAGLLEIIPSLGPLIATIPAIIVALLQGSSYLPVSPLVLTGLVIIFYALLQQIENNVIVPRVIGGAVDLPPLVVLIGVVVGTSVGGILGALLATPIIATAREIVGYFYRKMLGEEPFSIDEAALKPDIPHSKHLLQSLRDRLQKLAKPNSAAPYQRLSSSDPESKDDQKG